MIKNRLEYKPVGKMKRIIVLLLLSTVVFMSLVPGAAAEQEELITEHKISEKLNEAIDELTAAAEKIVEEKYDHAKELLYTRHFKEAKKIFKELGSYRDSKELLRMCTTYPANEPEFKGKLTGEDKIDRVYHGGILYEHYYGLFYVPNEVNAKTSFVLYHSGGGGEENWLYYSGLYRYFDNYEPNSIIFFTDNSGLNRYQAKNAEMFRIFQQIAYECGVIVHDASAVGSSSGSFTAMKAAASWYKDYGIRMNNVCNLDAGVEWEDTRVLTEEECDIVAEAGTIMYHFEQPDVGMNKAPIKRMVDHGVETYIVACRHDNHNTISVNAYVYGIFSWSGGADFDLPEYEYQFIKLEKGMKENPPVTWELEPEEFFYSPKDRSIQDAEP